MSCTAHGLQGQGSQHMLSQRSQVLQCLLPASTGNDSKPGKMFPGGGRHRSGWGWGGLEGVMERIWRPHSFSFLSTSYLSAFPL